MHIKIFSIMFSSNAKRSGVVPFEGILFRKITYKNSISVFQDEPKLPPSRSRALQIAQPQINKTSIAPIGRLLGNKQFLQLCFSCGFTIGLFDAYITMFNEMYLTYFEVVILLITYSAETKFVFIVGW